MKSLKLMVAALIAVITNILAFGQMHDHSQMTSVKTETFTVFGNCDMCKTRIEKAAKIGGVTKAVWHKDTEVLTLEYDPEEVTPEDILKKVAAAGHDNEKFKASDEVYSKLPGCCKYKREI